jgi:unsaturated rhamnogalacturonyl hydrolase
MPALQFDEQKVRSTIDLVVKRTMKMDFSWDWPAGVAFYGISRAWEVTGDKSYIDYVANWADGFIKAGLPKMTVNAVSLGHTMITLYDATGEEKYLEVAKAKAEYLSKEAVSFGERVFQHTVSQNYNFPEQAWAHTLFMAALFLLKLGVKLENKAYMDDGLSQYYWHEEFLQDPVTNLYYHAWDNINKNHLSGIYWARANAWTAITSAEALRQINAMNPSFMRIGDALRDQISALVRLQSPNGLWHTVLNEETSYEEVSASSGIAGAIVIFSKVFGHGIYNQYIEKALTGILNNIGEDGTVRNVSAGTAVMHNIEGYRNVPRKRIQGWGQGLALAFLSSLLEKK